MDVIDVAERHSGSADDEVLALATELSRPLVTCDKDFGDLVFRQGYGTRGVLLLRMPGLDGQAKASVVRRAWPDLEESIIGSFIVLGPGVARIRPLHSNPDE